MNIFSSIARRYNTTLREKAIKRTETRLPRETIEDLRGRFDSLSSRAIILIDSYRVGATLADIDKTWFAIVIDRFGKET